MHCQPDTVQLSPKLVAAACLYGFLVIVDRLPVLMRLDQCKTHAAGQHRVPGVALQGLLVHLVQFRI